MSKTRPGLKKIREFDGVCWYEFSDFMKAPAQRLLSVQEATNFAELGLSKEEHMALLDLTIDTFNKGKFTEAAAVIHHMKARMLIDFSETALLQLAASYYVIDEEDPDKYDLGFEEKKVEMLHRNPEAKAFFLSLSAKLINKLPKELEKNIKNSLQTIKEMDLTLEPILKTASPSLQETFKKLKSVYSDSPEKQGKDLKNTKSENG